MRQDDGKYIDQKWSIYNITFYELLSIISDLGSVLWVR